MCFLFLCNENNFFSNLVLKILIISFLKMSPAKFLSRVDVILEVTPTTYYCNTNSFQVQIFLAKAILRSVMTGDVESWRRANILRILIWTWDQGQPWCHSLLHVDTYYLLMNLVMVYFSADYGGRLTAIAAVKSRRNTVVVDNRN